MPTLFLVRHGQASFGADDYDCLSPLGHRQCGWLGEYFRARGLRFESALVGTLKRQTQSLAGVLAGLGEPQLPTLSWPGLNEYDSEAVIRSLHPAPLPRPDSAEAVRQHFRLLRDGLAGWMAGELAPAGMPSYVDFRAGVAGALAHVCREARGDVLLVASGGPISIAMGEVLGLAPPMVVELNLRLRNSAVTEFSVSPKGHRLVSFNAVPHLETPERRGAITLT
ncbi:histidine phosphatase family protein [Piscinibacter sakaiensis]|nr:histidine phosphatase family protein [Piscinibacter sakaiensis]